MAYKAYEFWGKRPEEGHESMAARAKGSLQEMESTKQLVTLLKSVYKPGMRVLDVGCNHAHYLRGVRRIDPNLEYKGVDAYEYYVQQAREIYKEDKKASFDVKDIMKPIFPNDPYDIVYCCNVLLHLPFFQKPIENLVQSTKKYLFIRTLLSDRTTIVKRSWNNVFDDNGEPLDFAYQNTYETRFFVESLKKLGCGVEIIEDEFDASILTAEYTAVKKGQGTRMLDGVQVDGNVLYYWKWVKVEKR